MFEYYDASLVDSILLLLLSPLWDSFSIGWLFRNFFVSFIELKPVDLMVGFGVNDDDRLRVLKRKWCLIKWKMLWKKIRLQAHTVWHHNHITSSFSVGGKIDHWKVSSSSSSIGFSVNLVARQWCSKRQWSWHFKLAIVFIFIFQYLFEQSPILTRSIECN